MQSWLEPSNRGKLILNVLYCPEKRDWDIQIEEALTRHNVTRAGVRITAWPIGGVMTPLTPKARRPDPEPRPGWKPVEIKWVRPDEVSGFCSVGVIIEKIIEEVEAYHHGLSSLGGNTDIVRES